MLLLYVKEYFIEISSRGTEKHKGYSGEINRRNLNCENLHCALLVAKEKGTPRVPIEFSWSMGTLGSKAVLAINSRISEMFFL